MEAWELDAREQIRDLVAAYNAHGDRGRFDELLALFAHDASMDIGDGATYEGVNAIRSIFTDTRDSVVDAAGPKFLQHHTTGLLLAVADREHATGHAYFAVMTDRGIDHWGRYQDAYRLGDDAWQVASRRGRTDGRTPGGWADQRVSRGGT